MDLSKKRKWGGTKGSQVPSPQEVLGLFAEREAGEGATKQLVSLVLKRPLVAGVQSPTSKSRATELLIDRSPVGSL